MWQSGSPGFPTLLLSTRAPLPNKTSCFVSTCVSSDNSFLSVKQEPSFEPWKRSPFLQQDASWQFLSCCTGAAGEMPEATGSSETSQQSPGPRAVAPRVEGSVALPACSARLPSPGWGLPPPSPH